MANLSMFRGRKLTQPEVDVVSEPVSTAEPESPGPAAETETAAVAVAVESPPVESVEPDLTPPAQEVQEAHEEIEVSEPVRETVEVEKKPRKPRQAAAKPVLEYVGHALRRSRFYEGD